ncbi:HEAT repeat domain-containing protein [Streptacidiphilus rugosus]|uniref:HEAT repeat domain-containing protein n=1 Tax=Streptacidiphilus rugosus TaxID=405783 RepID=UPI0012F945AE|nr:HEAT repeat domain-containing protein [Streptacidiphilus rugosus]
MAGMDHGSLAGLDDVPWAELWHAYGLAVDVPDQLRAMQAGDWEGRYPPIAQLANHIVHQGTRYQAAVHTIPFLVRMALDAGQTHRDQIVGLLCSIAIGLEDDHLPSGYDPREDVSDRENLRSQADEWAQWIAEAPDADIRKQRQESCRQLLGQAEAAVRSYDAVKEALPSLAVLLRADSPELRAETANLLAWFPESAPVTIPLLKAFIVDEVVPGAAATGLVALGLLGDPAVVSFLQGYLESAVAELRWAAAFALTRFGMDEPAVVDVLLHAAACPPEKTRTMSFLSGSYLGLTTMALADTSEATTPRGVGAVLTGLATCVGSQWSEDTHYTETSLIPRVFPGASAEDESPWPADPVEPRVAFEELNPAQQQVLRYIADQGKTWSNSGRHALEHWTVPTSADDLRAYIAAASNPDGRV